MDHRKEKSQIAVLWIVTPCSDVVGYRRFGGPCRLHFLTLKIKVKDSNLNLHRLEKLKSHIIEVRSKVKLCLTKYRAMNTCGKWRYSSTHS